MIRLTLAQPLLDDIGAHGEERYPEEASGLLLGRGDALTRDVTQLLPIQNEFESDQRYHRYQIPAQAMMEAEDLADEFGLAIVGVFHSHPDHPNSPSEFDLQWALPWFIYLITTVREGRAGESRAWQLSDDRQRFDEVPVVAQPQVET